MRTPEDDRNESYIEVFRCKIFCLLGDPNTDGPRDSKSQHQFRTAFKKRVSYVVSKLWLGGGRPITSTYSPCATMIKRKQGR